MFPSAPEVTCVSGVENVAAVPLSGRQGEEILMLNPCGHLQLQGNCQLL